MTAGTAALLLWAGTDVSSAVQDWPLPCPWQPLKPSSPPLVTQGPVSVITMAFKLCTHQTGTAASEVTPAQAPCVPKDSLVLQENPSAFSGEPKEVSCRLLFWQLCSKALLESS